MKIKSIAAICKRNKRVVLFNKYGAGGDLLAQYISNGGVVYPIFGLPELDAESILTIFDVPEKDREKWFVKCAPMPEEINLEDTDEDEFPVEDGALSLIHTGIPLKPLRTRRGLVFIDSRYLSPMSDVLDVLGLYERATPYGSPYIVAKAGLMLQAAIMPRDVITSQFVENMRELARECAVSLERREREREQAAARAVAGDPTQCTFNVDASTGEVLDGESEAGEE